MIIENQKYDIDNSFTIPPVLAINLKGLTHIGTNELVFLDKLFAAFKKQEKSTGEIEFVLWPENKQIDLAIFGFIILKKQFQEYRTIDITFNVEHLNENHPLHFILRQYAAFSYFFSGGIFFKIKYRNELIFKVDEKEKWMAISDEFLPCFLISKKRSEIYNALFNQFNNTSSLLQLFDERVDYPQFQKGFFAKKTVLVSDYAFILLARALSRAGSKIKEDLRSKNNEKEFVRNLSDQNCYTLIIFSILLIHTSPSKEKMKKKGAAYNWLMDILAIAQSNSRGIQELATNILEHATSKTGILCARFYKDDDLFGMRKNETDFDDYFQSFAEIKSTANKTYFFDINIMDESDLGILDTNTMNKKDLSEMFILQDDLKENEYSQYIKTTAKIGLISFRQAINSLNGFFSVTSRHNGNESTFSQYGNYKSINASSKYISGTLYSIVIPQISELSPSFNIRTEPEKIEFSRIGDLQSYHFLPFNNLERIKSLSANNKIICEIDIKDSDLRGLEKYKYELKYYEKTKEYLDTIKSRFPFQKIIPLINLNENKGSKNLGYFLRIFANISLNDLFEEVIVLGAEWQMVTELFRILRKTKLFWGYRFKILFYFDDLSVIENAPPSAVLLAGDTYEEFININRVYCNINLDQPIKKKDIHAFESLFVRSTQKKIIEFDVLVEKDTMTLFEIFTQKCLNKEIT